MSKLLKIVKNIKDNILSEGKLSDWPGYNTPAALKKEKELEGKKEENRDKKLSLFKNKFGDKQEL